jgi:hypothetical protein
MPTIEVQVQRLSVVSLRPFEDVVATRAASIGHPDMNAFRCALVAKAASKLASAQQRKQEVSDG